MKVVVTGAAGQLGREIVLGWSDDAVTGLTRDDLDITDDAAVQAAVRELAPDVVVHSAAWSDVDACEGDPERAHAVNALAAGSIARACAATGAAMVHLSTDYVFDGVAPLDDAGMPRGFSELDPAAPRSVYGRTKAAGEDLVREALDRHHIVRTAWLCGAHGRNFVTTMLRLADRDEPIRVVDDQQGSPTFTADLSTALRELAMSDTFGTWHRTNSGHASWFDLAAATFELAGLDVDLVPQASTALARRAPRPAWSVLDSPRAAAAGLAPLPHWRRGLTQLLDELGALA